MNKKQSMHLSMNGLSTDPTHKFRNKYITQRETDTEDADAARREAARLNKQGQMLQLQKQQADSSKMIY